MKCLYFVDFVKEPGLSDYLIALYNTMYLHKLKLIKKTIKIDERCVDRVGGVVRLFKISMKMWRKIKKYY